ncbi:Uncharacterized protein Rs2_48075 [Raphanus sativus]|nr:Uncharacterized protein Rs2_48075 [Raphanus sativus]
MSESGVWPARERAVVWRSEAEKIVVRSWVCSGGRRLSQFRLRRLSPGVEASLAPPSSVLSPGCEGEPGVSVASIAGGEKRCSQFACPAFDVVQSRRVFLWREDSAVEKGVWFVRGLLVIERRSTNGEREVFVPVTSRCMRWSRGSDDAYSVYGADLVTWRASLLHAFSLIGYAFDLVGRGVYKQTDQENRGRPRSLFSMGQLL